MRVRFVNLGLGALPLFHMPCSYVYIMNEHGQWEPRVFVGRSLLVSLVDVMPWDVDSARPPREDWILFQKFLGPRLTSMHYQLDGILSIIVRSKEYMGFVWSANRLRLKTPDPRADRTPPSWFPV